MNSSMDDKTASLKFELKWERHGIKHKDVYFSDRINFWRDCFPPVLYEYLVTIKPGGSITMPIKKGTLIPGYSSFAVHDIKTKQLDTAVNKDLRIIPRTGRFYPKGILKGIPRVFKGNMVPFRCMDINDDSVTINFNHPLAGIDMELTAHLLDVKEKNDERGGSCTDWIETITDGPGMKARINGQPTQFFFNDPFKREDDNLDSLFYEKTRMVSHVDSEASKTISEIYGNILKPGMIILDLMSSWESHLPEKIDYKKVIGLGMNKNELTANSMLNDYVVHDLNEQPVLPFESNMFDTVICSLSIEYLIRPFNIFREIARVLKPGGYLVITFSNRWFPPKSISIWKELHEFERTGLVIEYFLESSEFADIHTQSVRGLPRPEDDKYFPEQMYADPVYAVWGRKRNRV